MKVLRHAVVAGCLLLLLANAAMAAGTFPYRANSMVNCVFPCVIDRSIVEYPNISESGASASTRAKRLSSDVLMITPRR